MNASLAPGITVKGVVEGNGATAMESGAQTTINIYPQTLDQATIDYLFLKFNARLGAAICGSSILKTRSAADCPSMGNRASSCPIPQAWV